MERPWRIVQKREGDERRDAHNTSVDVTAAREHRCGTIDLRRGRVCLLPEHHPGSCQFSPIDHERFPRREGASL